MLAQLLSAMSPELIMHSIRQNPKVFLDTLHKFESFNLVSAALSTNEQEAISKHISLLNPFLKSDNGRAAMHFLAEEFIDFANKQYQSADDKIRAEVELKYRAELENKIRAELAAKAA